MTGKRTLRGRGALQVRDLRCLEDGGKRGGALVSNIVVVETAGEEEWRVASVSTGVDISERLGQRRTPVRSQSST